jgi:hypothetical protein
MAIEVRGVAGDWLLVGMSDDLDNVDVEGLR